MLGRVVDFERYPVGEAGSAGGRALVSQVRRELEEIGCCVLPGFVRKDVQEGLREECAGVAGLAHFDVERVNVYNTAVGGRWAEGHPGRIEFWRGNAFVARDRIPRELMIQRLYASEVFQRFVANCFGLEGVHELADPLSGLCLNIVRPGMEHPWHFDTNEFTVSMLTQEPEDGGFFEYCPGIRSEGAENFEDVLAVLEGKAAHRVRRLRLRPGDLQLFKGRFSLHRVSPVEGATERHTAIFAYSERPGVIGSVERTRQLFGRVLPEHVAAAGQAVRGDRLLD